MKFVCPLDAASVNVLKKKHHIRYMESFVNVTTSVVTDTMMKYVLVQTMVLVNVVFANATKDGKDQIVAARLTNKIVSILKLIKFAPIVASVFVASVSVTNQLANMNNTLANFVKIVPPVKKCATFTKIVFSVEYTILVL